MRYPVGKSKRSCYAFTENTPAGSNKKMGLNPEGGISDLKCVLGEHASRSPVCLADGSRTRGPILRSRQRIGGDGLEPAPVTAAGRAIDGKISLPIGDPKRREAKVAGVPTQ